MKLTLALLGLVILAGAYCAHELKNCRVAAGESRARILTLQADLRQAEALALSTEEERARLDGLLENRDKEELRSRRQLWDDIESLREIETADLHRIRKELRWCRAEWRKLKDEDDEDEEPEALPDVEACGVNDPLPDAVIRWLRGDPAPAGADGARVRKAVPAGAASD